MLIKVMVCVLCFYLPATGLPDWLCVELLQIREWQGHHGGPGLCHHQRHHGECSHPPPPPSSPSPQGRTENLPHLDDNIIAFVQNLLFVCSAGFYM